MLDALGVLIIVGCASLGYEIAAWYGPNVGINFRSGGAGRAARLTVVAMTAGAVIVAIVWSIDAVAGVVTIVGAFVLIQVVFALIRLRRSRERTASLNRSREVNDHLDQ